MRPRDVFYPLPALRLCILTVVLLASLPVVSGFSASPQEVTSPYPTSPVSLLLPVPQGDQALTPFSLALPFLSAHSKLNAPPVVFSYKPGRGGGYALRDLAAAPADGSVVAGLPLSSFLLAARATSQPGLYKTRDITPLTIFARLPVALWVPNDSLLATVKQLVEKARGASLSPPVPFLIIGGTGSGTAQHMAHAMLNRAAGIQTLYMPFTGSGQCAEAARQGQVDACWGYALAPGTMPGMRAVAVADASPSPVLPQTPIFEEDSLAVDIDEYLGVCMSSGVAPFIREAATAFFDTVAADPAFQAALKEAGCIPEAVSGSDLDMLIIRRNTAVDDFLQRYGMPGFRPAQ